MPFVAPKSTPTSGNAAGRNSFRPPWVKEDGAQSSLKPTTKTSVPWAKKAVDATESETPGPGILKKTVPSTNSNKTNAQPNATLKKVTEPMRKTNNEPEKSVTSSVKKIPEVVKKPAAVTNMTKSLAGKKKEPTPPSSSEEEETDEEEETEEETEETEEETEEESEEETEEEVSEASSETDNKTKNGQKPKAQFNNKTTTTPPIAAKKIVPAKTQPAKKEEEIPAPPPLPSLVPKAPPPPPPFGKDGSKKELSEARKNAIEKLKTRPRRRPDWSEMMKEVESGKKLRHVDCNDRSQPILTCKSMTKVDNKFIYETEKDNSHNKLLKQIQGGIKLRPTQTRDRSKPFIEGLRKFRKQMTIEEQLQKSQSKINMLGANAPDTTDGVAPAPGSSRSGSIVSGLVLDDPSGDELDDIDKIRDDLQSTKQMLALELRNREAQERENKKLLAKIATLEAELEREKSREKNFEYGSRIIVATMETTPKTEAAFVQTLKQEAEESKQTAQELEKKYLTTGEQLDQAKSEIEEQKRQIQVLEKKLAQALQGNGLDSRRASDVLNGRDSGSDFDMPESESDPDEPEEKKAERREKRLVKEIKVLRSKLTKLKVKEEAAKKEKMALKEAMKKNHVLLKEENKKFKRLEKEVHKMAASMKEDIDDDEEHEDEEEKEEPEEEQEESEEESEESESEESGNETASESEAEDASSSAKKDNLEPRVKKHEGRLSAMKKCNVLLQANVDNLQDEISQVRYKASNLQSELDSVLADLGF